jgi:hypothetical protein
MKPRALLSVVTLAAVLSATAACSAPARDKAGSAGSTSTTIFDGVESTTTTTPAVTIPGPQVPIAFGDPAADRAPVPGSVTVPEPTMAQLCTGGYVKKTTPSAAVTNPIKASLLAESSFADRDPSHYVLDQLIPIELGGAPTDARNLWLQTEAMAAVKERDERRLRTELCAGRITLAAAQTQMVTNWGPLPKH